jgi:hypothetical protein
MKPSSPVLKGFPHVVYAKDQKEYSPLPAILCADDQGTVITRWSLSLWERLKVMFGGSIYHQQLTFKGALQPIFVSVSKPCLSFTPTHDEEGNLYTGGGEKLQRVEATFIPNERGREQ